MNNNIKKFLRESNAIEGVYSNDALEDAISAWEFAYKNRNNITVDYILGIHKLLMSRLRPDIAGKIRDCDVFIGGERKFFISESLIKGDLMMKVCFEMIAKGNFDKEDKAKQAHIAFEYIHPFEDGNGRVGRILYNIHRLNFGLDAHIIHEGEEQYEYYKWFKQKKI